MAWTILLYVFTAFLSGGLIFYIFTKSKKPKTTKNSPLKRYKDVCQILPIGTRKGWEFIAVENGLRLWEKSELDNGLMFASSMILPVSLEILMKILTNPSIVREWDPWVKSISRISMSNEKESSQLSGDVISVTEAPNSSSKVIETFDTLVRFFKSDSKLYSRVWTHEENIQFWLHSAVVDPQSYDPVYTLFIAFPIKEMKNQCEVTVVCDAMPSFNPCSLTAKLAGLKDYIVCSQSEVVYPDTEETDSVVVDDEDQEFEENNQDEAPGENVKPPSEAFVDVTGVYLRPEKDVQKYKVAIDNAIKKIMEYYNAKAGENGWAFVGNVKNINILKKPASHGFSIWDCAKGTGEVNVPVHYLIAYIKDLEHTAEYDDMFKTGHVIEDLGELTNISYLEYKPIWPVSGRDFCAFNAIRILPDDIYVVVARSIKHPSCPPCKKYVRGKILIGGFIIEELSKDPPRTRVTYVTHVDLAGMVPSRIVNKVTASQPQSVALVKHYAEKMYQEELDNPDSTSKFKENAMRMFGKLERARNVVENAKSTATTETLDEQPSPPIAVASTNGDVRRSSVSQVTQDSDCGGPSSTPPKIHTSVSTPQFHSPTIKLSPFDNVAVDYKTIGNQSSAGLLQEVFEVAEVDITKPGGSSATVNEQWEYRGMEKEVMMFRKIHSNEKMHSMIGKGIVPCSPSKVWDVLKEPKQRYKYDNMLKETRILEKISESVAIEYLHFETENCFQKQARDFVVLRTERKEKDKYLLSVMSIDYQNSPVKKDVKRGKILASGWVVEPMLHSGQLYSLVTYLSQVNPGGNYPANLINLVAKKQPMCVAYLRRYLQNPSFPPTDSSE